MSTALLPLTGPIVYPESDGEPMADNTRQLRWMIVLIGNLAALFRDAPDVFVGGNQFWYPVEGEPGTRQAPDVYVVFGRPKGDRGSYKQWEEGNVPMTVVFEILSPGNTIWELADTFDFYETHGVEEYYLYDPDCNRLLVYRRRGDVLRRVLPLRDFVSPRLGIRFDLSGPEMVVRGPDGQPFLTFEQLQAARKLEQQQRLLAEQRADQAEQRADQAEQRADEEQRQRQQAEQRLEQEQQQRLLVQQRAARLAELNRKARRQQATAEELAELERLEEQLEPGG
jgi:Uma2 family endonuclease